MNFERVLKEVTGFFERESFDYAVIGAFALHAYGWSRATGDLDFIYVSGDSSRLLFESARNMLVLGDMSIPVPRAEHFAAMKIHAMKNDPERTFQETADILFLMQLPGINKSDRPLQPDVRALCGLETILFLCMLIAPLLTK